MKHFKVRAPVALQRQHGGWEEEPIAAGVSASDVSSAISAYQKRVRSLYVDSGKFADVDFYSSQSEYTIKELDEPLSW